MTTASQRAGGRLARLAVAFVGILGGLMLLASACGDPQVPVAASAGGIDALVTATPTPAPPTPTPTVTPIPTPTPRVGATPEPTPLPILQPGLSNTSVRVVVIADVTTGGTADDLFRDAWTATTAWAAEVNSRGGLGDRMVEVTTLDAGLFNHASQIEEVCSGAYFAIVGSQSLGDAAGAELLGTEDCNLADFSADVHGARRAESANTFIPNPFYNDLRQAGPARWLLEEYPDTSENVSTFWFDELQLRNETERLQEVLLGVGFTIAPIDTSLDEGPSERIIARYEELESQAILWNADPGRLIDLLVELRDNELDPTWVLCELACYSEAFLRTGGTAVEGVYTWIPHVPFDDPSASQELITYRFWLNEFLPGAEWSEVGLQSWMAGRLFEESFNELLRVEPEAPTREKLIAAARSIDDFTAEGILPALGVNTGERQPTPCFVLMVVEDGRWAQAHPEPGRDRDCARENLWELVATRNRGLEAPVVTSSTTSEATTPDDDAEVDLDNPEEVPNE